MLANVLMSTAEETWWNLTFEDRVHYERCVHHIVYTHFRANIVLCRDFVTKARLYGFAYGHPNSKLVRAILWRIEEELSDE